MTGEKTTDDSLDFDAMMEVALRSVVRQALSAVVENGLPGAHHFYITFQTTADGVDVPDFLREQFPEEMTIILQHQYWNLEVEETAFSVMLSFNNTPTELYIPYDALTGFVDPSVKFGLQFGRSAPNLSIAGAEPDGSESIDAGSEPVEDGETDIAQLAQKTEGEQDGQADPQSPSQSAEVVTLDQFRKKK